MTRSVALPVVVVALSLGLAHAVLVPAFWPVDETAHVAYADQLLGGELPTIDTPIPADRDWPGLAERLAWERREGRGGRQDVWTANHPPLPYVLYGGALRVGELVGGSDLALLAARLVAVVWGAAAVAATMALAVVLRPASAWPSRGPRTRRGRSDQPDLPHRPADLAVPALAGLLVAVTPTISHLSGVTFTDMPSLALSTACLAVGVTIARRGPSRRRTALLALACGAAALTRISCLPAVGIAVALAAHALWRRRHDEDLDRRTAVLGGVAVLAAMLPAAAFWALNLVRYDSFTATGALLRKFGRDLNAPLDTLLTSREVWFRLWNRMLADLTTGHWNVGLRARLTESVLLVIIAAVVWAGVRSASRWVRAETRPDRTLLLCWTGCLAVPLALLASTMQFHSAGGSLHGRYLIGGFGVMAVGVARVLLTLPVRWMRITAAAWVVSVLLVANGSLLRMLAVDGNATWTRRGIEMDLPLVAGQATVPLLLLAAALLVVGLARLGWLVGITLGPEDWIRRITGSWTPWPPTPRTPEHGRDGTPRTLIR